MHATRIIGCTLAIAAGALLPTAALARNGADDSPSVPDDKGGLTAPSKNGGGTTVKRVTGTCTDGSTAKLKVKPDDARLETEFEVDQNRNGVKWEVRIRRDGNLVVRTNATTRAPSGSFSVERRVKDGAGSDRITARATSPSGEVCTAGLTV
jgi:hypothetical protein